MEKYESYPLISCRYQYFAIQIECFKCIVILNVDEYDKAVLQHRIFLEHMAQLLVEHHNFVLYVFVIGHHRVINLIC